MGYITRPSCKVYEADSLPCFEQDEEKAEHARDMDAQKYCSRARSRLLFMAIKRSLRLHETKVAYTRQARKTQAFIGQEEQVEQGDRT